MISVESRWASPRQNGQKRSEEIYKDGELISEKFWNPRGEEVETYEESRKYPHPAQIRVDWIREINLPLTSDRRYYSTSAL